MKTIRLYFSHAGSVGRGWWWADGTMDIPRVGEYVYLPFSSFRVASVGYHIPPFAALTIDVHVSVDLGSTLGLTESQVDQLIESGELEKAGWQKISARPF